MNSNQEENKKVEKIGFWDFLYEKGDLVENLDKHIIQLNEFNPFPKELIEEEQFKFIAKKLGNRIKVYENSPCFGFLEKFYQNFQLAYNSQTKEDYQNKYYLAKANLQLFTFCSEKESNKNKNNLINPNF
jgi:hypothetical protein